MPQQAADFVRQAGVDLSRTIAGAGTDAEKESRLAPFLARVVDEDGVARFCLGRYWTTATQEQRTEYLQLFHKQLLNGVVSRLGNYQASASKVTILAPQLRADGMLVPTIVEKDGSKPVNISWLVVQSSGELKIGDVIAEGMSLRLTQRSDYASFLSRNGGNLDVLINALRQQQVSLPAK